MTIPRVARLMAQRTGTVLAWVDIAITEKKESELLTIREHQQLWEDMIAGADPLAALMGDLGTVVMLLLGTLRPNIEAGVEESAKEKRKLRIAYRDLSKGIFRKTLIGYVPEGHIDVTGADPELEDTVNLYGDWVLRGWKAELQLLGYGTEPFHI